MTGPIPKKKKEKPQLTPEQVAAHESMKPDPYAKQKGIGAAAPYSRNKKKTPTLNHTTCMKTKPKNGIHKAESEYEVYTETGTWREKAINEKGLDSLATELIEWARKKGSLKMNTFFNSKNIAKSTFLRLKKKHKNLERAYACALLSLGDNREIGAILKEYDRGMILPIMHQYDPDWKKSDEWRAEINTQKQNINQGIQVVEIPAAEKTSIVPPLKKDKEE